MKKKRKLGKYGKKWGKKIKSEGGFYEWGRWWTGDESEAERDEAKVRYIRKRYRHFREPFFQPQEWLTVPKREG